MKTLHVLVTAIALTVSTSGLLLGNSCRHTNTSFNCVTYEKNYDGDTISFHIPHIHPFFTSMNIRVQGIDTPEIRSKDPCERVAATYVREYVKSKMQSASLINLTNVKRGKYFRLVADIMIDGTNLAQIMLQEGLAVEYDGKTKPKVNWCNISKNIHQ